MSLFRLRFITLTFRFYSLFSPAVLPVFGLTRCTDPHARQVTPTKTSPPALSDSSSSGAKPCTWKPVFGMPERHLPPTVTAQSKSPGGPFRQGLFCGQHGYGYCGKSQDANLLPHPHRRAHRAIGGLSRDCMGVPVIIALHRTKSIGDEIDIVCGRTDTRFLGSSRAMIMGRPSNAERTRNPV